VQSVRAVVGDEQEFSGLHSGSLVRCDDVGLHHNRHPAGEREVGHGRELAAARAEDRRQIAADEAVHEIVAGREAGILDQGGSRHELCRRRARAEPAGHGVEMPPPRRRGARGKAASGRPPP
jgi:hypothetical protein